MPVKAVEVCLQIVAKVEKQTLRAYPERINNLCRLRDDIAANNRDQTVTARKYSRAG